MPTSRRVAIVVAMSMLVPAAALASPVKPTTVSPGRAQRSAILRAFGSPKAAWPCLIVRLAASDRRYGTVRPRRTKNCLRWAFNGTNILERGKDEHWRIAFEGSAYRCPLPRIPARVQRGLRVCPRA